MVQRVDSIQTIFLDAQHPWDEIFSLARYTMPDRSWKIQIVLDDGSVELLTNTSIVRRLARQEHVEDYPDWPHVALLGVNATQDFWGAEVTCTVHLVKIFIADAPWDTKIGKFYKLIVMGAEENVVWLNVAVDIALGMKVTSRW